MGDVVLFHLMSLCVCVYVIMAKCGTRENGVNFFIHTTIQDVVTTEYWCELLKELFVICSHWHKNRGHYFPLSQGLVQMVLYI